MSAMPEMQPTELGIELPTDLPLPPHLQPQQPPKKKGKKKIVLILLLVLLLGGGYYGAKKTILKKPVYAAGQPVPNGLTYSLGTLTVNTLGGGHYAQVSIVLQLTKPADTKEIAEDRPQLMNDCIQDISSYPYARLLQPATRQALQAQLLTSFQKILGPVDGTAPQVSAVYFTSFLTQ